jgi:hypothetical protein
LRVLLVLQWPKSSVIPSGQKMIVTPRFHDCDVTLTHMGMIQRFIA